MPTKAKSIAISGICGAVATICLLLCSLPATKWIVVILAVVASVAVAIPTLTTGKVIFSILTYVASSVIGVFVGLANIMYVAPIVAFCMPMAIIKINAETIKVTAKMQEQTIDDPFGNGDDKQVVAMQVDAKPRMKTFVKWILYYVVLQFGIALTLGATYLFMRPTFEFLLKNNVILWICLGFQLLPLPFDFLLRGSFVLMAKALKRFVD